MTIELTKLNARLELVRQHMTEHRDSDDRIDFGVDPLFNDAGELGSAVQAVLELHTPEAHPLAPTDLKCKGCNTHVTFTHWPCATVTTIAEKLGVAVAS